MKDIIQSLVALMIGTLFVGAAGGLMNSYLGLQMNQAGFATTTSGLLMSVYFIGLTLGSLRSHALIGRVGHIRSFAAFAALYGITTLLYGLEISAPLWALWRFLSGVGFAGLLVCIESWLNGRANNQTRGRIFALYVILYYIGLGIGQQALKMPVNETFNMFSAGAVMSMLSLVPVVMTKFAGPTIEKASSFPLRELIRLTPLGVAGCIASGLITSSFYTMGAIFAQKSGLDLDQTSTFMTTVILGGTLMQFPIGRFSDKYDRRIVMLAIGSFTALVTLILPWIRVSAFPVLLFLSFLYGAGIFSMYPLSVSHANDNVPPEHVVPASSQLVLLFSFGSILGPTFVSLFMLPFGARGFFVATFTGLAAITVFCFQRLRQKPEIVPVTKFAPVLTHTAVLPNGEIEPELLDPEEKEPVEKIDPETIEILDTRK